MRSLPALALAAAALALSGCVADAADGPLFPDRHCRGHSQQAYSYLPGALLPSDVPADRPSVSIEVGQGQTLTAVATWRADAGQAQVVFDGPSQHSVQTDQTWTSTAPNAAAGTYTLSLEGAPLAASVTYTLLLSATGCTSA